MRHPGRSDGQDRVTIREVAAAAGVSTATVSRALSRPGLVSPALADRVRSIASSLHYVPNASARALSSLHSGLVGVVVPDLARHTATVSALAARLAEAGLATLLREGSNGDAFADRDVEGVVIIDAAQIDLSAAADALAGHLGAAEVGYVGDVGDWLEAVRHRIPGERVDPACLPLPDALVCADDLVALRVLKVCQRRGVRVPDDIAVVGFGDLPFARSAQPSLTSVRLPERALGVALAEGILARRAGQPAARVALSAKLVVRRSTGGLFHVEPRPPVPGRFT